MGPVRVVHFADLHLGVETGGRANPETGLNQRIHDVCDRLDELCAYVEEESIHAVLFAGDAFKHQHPTPTLQRLFAERIRRLARSGARVFLLIGNHDLPKMASLSHPFSIYDALEVEGVVVGDRAEVSRLELARGAPALQVAALPHFSRHHVLAKLDPGTDPDEVIQHQVTSRVRSLGEGIDPSSPAVFVGHCHVNQAEVGSSQSLFGISDVEVTLSTLASTGAFGYYALGHVHKRQVLSNDPFVAYSGSLERVDFGEGSTVKLDRDGGVRRRPGEDKGFFRFDLVEDGGTWRLADEPEFVTVSARPFITIRSDLRGAEDPTDTVLARLDAAGLDVAGAFVKLVVDVDPADRPRVRRGELKARFPDAYDVRVVVESPPEAGSVRDPRFGEPMTEADALAAYLETKEEWADEREDLLRVGRDLIREVLS